MDLRNTIAVALIAAALIVAGACAGPDAESEQALQPAQPAEQSTPPAQPGQMSGQMNMMSMDDMMGMMHDMHGGMPAERQPE